MAKESIKKSRSGLPIFEKYTIDEIMTATGLKAGTIGMVFDAHQDAGADFVRLCVAAFKSKGETEESLFGKKVA